MKSKIILIAILLTAVLFACESIFNKGDDADNPAYKAYELRMSGQADSALVLLEAALAEDSTNALAWYELSRTTQQYLPQDMDKDQILAYLLSTAEKAIDLDPTNPQFYPYLIAVYDMNRDFSSDKSRADEWTKLKYDSYKKLIELEPEQIEHQFNLFDFCYDHKEELNYTDEMMQAMADDIAEKDAFYGELVHIYLDTLEYGCDHFKEMMVRYPGQAFLYEIAGNQCKEDEAIIYFNKAVSLDPDKAGLSCWMMKYLFFTVRQMPDSSKYVEQARAITDTFLALDVYPPVQAYIMASMGRIYNVTGDTVQGKEYWEMAMEKDPYFVDYPIHPQMVIFTPLK